MIKGNYCDRMYCDLIEKILAVGDKLRTRNSDCTRLKGIPIEFTSTPLVGVRKTAWKSALREWEWFMTGSNDINKLHPSVRPWWQPWADREGRVKYNYSQQFRKFHGTPEVSCGYAGESEGEYCSKEPVCVDQIDLLVRGLKDHPFSRRNVITTWNTADMVQHNCPITNCHGTVIQAFVNPDDTLDLLMYQRSVDVVCGLPHNWIQYWAFLVWLAHLAGRKVGRFIWVGGDIHVYQAHEELARKILSCRDEGSLEPLTPQLVYHPTSSDFKADDFNLDCEYSPVLTDRAEMIV